MINQIRTRVGVENWAHAHTKKKVLSFDSTLYIYIYIFSMERKMDPNEIYIYVRTHISGICEVHNGH